mgnify:CR=1 FL=1
MNEEILKGRWNQIKGEIQKEWGELTDNDIERAKGELTYLQGVIQEKYGHSKEEAKAKLDEFLAKFKDKDE